ncbi:MAG: hypothetical protein ACE5LS_02805 [Thermoplasmata archaeon]
MKNEESGAGRPPEPPWWLGPTGVLLGSVVILLAGIWGGLWRFPATILITIVAAPAISGYALRTVLSGGRRAALSSIGTAVGWILFITFLFNDLPILGEVAFWSFQIAQFFFPVGLLLPAALALGFILVAQWSASEMVARLALSSENPSA